VKYILAEPHLERNIRVIHLPYTFKGNRLNIADDDRAIRRRSIRLVVDTIKEAAALVNVRKYVTHPLALETWDGKPRGTYEAVVNSFKEMMERVEGYLHGPVVLENNRVYFEPGRSTKRRNRICGDNPDEWRRLAKDVGHPMFGLCLDTSHAVTTAQLLPKKQRDKCLREFLEGDDEILHVHWSGNFPYDRRGRNDSHEAIGKTGTQPLWFHRKVAALNASKTIEVLRPERADASIEYLRMYKLI
jgi:sugar phosphate isomerase/epimerase